MGVKNRWNGHIWRMPANLIADISDMPDIGDFMIRWRQKSFEKYSRITDVGKFTSQGTNNLPKVSFVITNHDNLKSSRMTLVRYLYCDSSFKKNISC